MQSHQLRILKEKGLIWEFAFLELEGQIKDLLTLQGKSERIKNFPYPRQFATLNHYFMWVFVLLLPLALVMQGPVKLAVARIHADDLGPHEGDQLLLAVDVPLAEPFEGLHGGRLALDVRPGQDARAERRGRDP